MKSEATIKKQPVKTGVVFKIGVGLLVLWVILWAAVFIVPFLPLSLVAKAGAATALGVVAEIFFVIGVLCTGKEFVQRYKDRLHPQNWNKRAD